MVLFYLLWTSSLRLIRNFSIVCRDLSEEKSVSSPRAWSIKKVHLIMFNFLMRSDNRLLKETLSHLISPFMTILIKESRSKVSSQQAYSESFFRLWLKVSMQNHSYENVFRQQRSFSCKSNSFSYERFCTKTRFETEAQVTRKCPVHLVETPTCLGVCVVLTSSHHQVIFFIDRMTRLPTKWRPLIYKLFLN